MRHFAKLLATTESRLNEDGPADFNTRVAAYRRLLGTHNKWLEQQRLKISGLKLGALRSDMVDDWLRHLLDVAVAGVRAAGHKPPEIALVSLGGCGRHEMNPMSDIDFTILHRGRAKVPPGLEEIVKEFLHIILACDYTPGHSTRNLRETVAEANKELQSKTAMLDARLLWGSEALFEEFKSRFRKECIRPFVKEYLQQRMRDEAERHAKDGDSVYMQEPNIKNGCGGLRDYQNLLWMARVKFGIEEITDTACLVERKYLDASERRELDSAYEWIFRLRTELHYLTGRPADVVILNQQLQLANRLGYAEKHPDVLRRVEALMRDYYTHARAIFDITQLVSRRLAFPVVENAGPRGLFRFLPFRRGGKARREEFDGFIAKGGEIVHSHRHIFREDSPRMMRLFQYVQLRGLELNPELGQLVRRRLKYVDWEFRYAKVNREVFADILRRKGQVGYILRSMHRVGFLGKWMPEFGGVTALVQHEFFHRYTVDEHTLLCVDKLDWLLDTEDERYAPHRDLFAKVEDPYILYLALLLHDTGKAANVKQHSVESTMNAAKVSRRLQLSSEQRALLLFLVDNHDLLAKTARNEDIYDAEVVENVARIVGTQANLQMLMLLTAADGMGVGDGKLWNDWVQSLIRELYTLTMHCITDSAGFRARRQTEREALREAVAARIGKGFEEEVDAHFTHMPERYFLITHGQDTGGAIVSHVKMVREFLETRWNTDDSALAPVLRWAPQTSAGHSELWVCTWDRAQLLARIAGALSAAELNILSADIFTRGDGIVLDKFRVCTPNFTVVEHPVDIRKVERLLTAALQVEHYDFDADLAKVRSRAWLMEKSPVFPASVWYDNRPQRHTAFEIIAPDHLGLLYELLTCIGDRGFEISSARITTEKGAAIDTIHITGHEGVKISDEAQLQSLKDALQRIANRGQ